MKSHNIRKHICSSVDQYASCTFNNCLVHVLCWHRHWHWTWWVTYTLTTLTLFIYTGTTVCRHVGVDDRLVTQYYNKWVRLLWGFLKCQIHQFWTPFKDFEFILDPLCQNCGPKLMMFYFFDIHKTHYTIFKLYVFSNLQRIWTFQSCASKSLKIT